MSMVILTMHFITMITTMNVETVLMNIIIGLSIIIVVVMIASFTMKASVFVNFTMPIIMIGAKLIIVTRTINTTIKKETVAAL